MYSVYSTATGTPELIVESTNLHTCNYFAAETTPSYITDSEGNLI